MTKLTRSPLKWLLLVLVISLVLVRLTLRHRPQERADRAGDGVQSKKDERSKVRSKSTRSRPETDKKKQQNGSDQETVVSVRKATELSTGAHWSSSSSSLLSPSVLPSAKLPHVVVKEADGQYSSKLGPKGLFWNSTSNVSHSFHPVQDMGNEKHDTSARVRPGAGANRTGYLTALQFWDQQTYSVQNILLLQAWAGWLGVGVLEPFLKGSSFGLPLADHEAFHDDGTVSYMAMSEIYDIDKWNSESGGHSYKTSPLTPWRDFLATAPPDVVFINLGQWTGYNDIKDAAHYNKTLEKLGFRLVDAHDIKLDGSNPLSEEDLKTLVYRNGISPSEVTVIFISLKKQDLPNVIPAIGSNMLGGKFVVSLQPSKTLMGNANRYIRKHLGWRKRYISVLVRAERLVIELEPAKREDYLRGCLHKAIGWLNALRRKTGLSKVFVGMDIGKMGSQTNKDNTMSSIDKLGVEFLRASYRDPRMTLTSWEDSFAELSSSQVPGYIAFLQKMIAVRGQCILLIGFGSFQIHALQAYLKLHTKEDYCFLQTESHCVVIKKTVHFQGVH